MTAAARKGNVDPAGAPAATELPRYLCLAGPTASGKSAAAMAIAAALASDIRVEIVSVDSALVYRGLDIGTAKPSDDERARVPHHLIDIIDPAEAYSAARFVADAGLAIEQIEARGAVPLLVGGTMLYFRVLFDGLDALPAADPAVRASIEREAFLTGWPAMHAALARVDPQAAARLPPHDAQRIQRALEVYRLTGRSLSSWHSGKRQALQPPLISLEPTDRAWLRERIDRRFDAMLAAGFLDEVRGLRKRADLDVSLPSMRAVGYRQAWAALATGDLDLLQAQVGAATRQLAKRQLTWLRGMGWREVVACDSDGALDEVVRRARPILEAIAGRNACHHAG